LIGLDLDPYDMGADQGRFPDPCRDIEMVADCFSNDGLDLTCRDSADGPIRR
jgi:hypothetical protein